MRFLGRSVLQPRPKRNPLTTVTSPPKWSLNGTCFRGTYKKNGQPRALRANGAGRRPRAGDRRARSLAVTQEATAVLPIIWGLITESQVAALKGLSTRERQVLMKALERVLVNLSLRGEAVG
jgi:hypothetical protein